MENELGVLGNESDTGEGKNMTRLTSLFSLMSDDLIE